MNIRQCLPNGANESSESKNSRIPGKARVYPESSKLSIEPEIRMAQVHTLRRRGRKAGEGKDEFNWERR